MSFDHSRTCDQLRCTDCDFKVSTFDNFQWKKDTDYLFLRNNMPDFDRLRSKLMPKKGTCLVPPVRSLEPPPGFLFFRPREAASQGGLSESCTCRRRDTPDGEHVTALTCGPNANELLLLLFQVYVRTLVSVSGNRWPSWKRLIQVTNGFVGNTDNERNHKTVNCYCSCKMSTWSQPTTRWEQISPMLHFFFCLSKASPIWEDVDFKAEHASKPGRVELCTCHHRCRCGGRPPPTWAGPWHDLITWGIALGLWRWHSGHLLTTRAMVTQQKVQRTSTRIMRKCFFFFFFTWPVFFPLCSAWYFTDCRLNVVSTKFFTDLVLYKSQWTKCYLGESVSGWYPRAMYLSLDQAFASVSKTKQQNETVNFLLKDAKICFVWPNADAPHGPCCEHPNRKKSRKAVFLAHCSFLWTYEHFLSFFELKMFSVWSEKEIYVVHATKWSTCTWFEPRKHTSLHFVIVKVALFVGGWVRKLQHAE